jgi:Holliday junction DNA helicase RuvB
MTEPTEILAGTALAEDAAVEPRLRPQWLSEYIGRTRSARTFRSSSRPRGAGRTLDHVLLTDPPGLGKTTLAYIVAREMGAGCADGGPMIARAGISPASDEPAAEGRPLRRRDPSTEPGREEILYPPWRTSDWT